MNNDGHLEAYRFGLGSLWCYCTLHVYTTVLMTIHFAIKGFMGILPHVSETLFAVGYPIIYPGGLAFNGERF